MGSVISNGANGLGSVIGNAFSAPFKTFFGGPCQDICSGPWDIMCFLNLCISSLIKLLTILGLCYIFLLFLYLLYKEGICQCIGRRVCKMCWVGCEAWGFAFEGMECYLWQKLINTKGVYHGRRRRIRDVELGYPTDESDGDGSLQVGRTRKTQKRKSH